MSVTSCLSSVCLIFHINIFFNNKTNKSRETFDFYSFENVSLYFTTNYFVFKVDNYELFGLTFPNSTTINTLIFSLNFTMISSETLSVLDIESSQKDQ